MRDATKISFLDELGEELLDVAWREGVGPARSKTKPRRLRWIPALAAAIVILAGVGTLRLLGHESGGSPAARQANLDAEVPDVVPPRAPSPDDPRVYTGADLFLDPSTHDSPRVGEQAGNGGSSTALGSEPKEQTSGSPVILDQVIKTASLSVAVAKGEIQQSLQEANQAAADHGGYVQASKTSEGVAATLTIRIPAQEFEATIGDLQALGHVESESTHGQDVSSQSVDLHARLRIAQQRVIVLSRLMQRAHGISEVLRFRDELEQAQLEVEQIRGQLRVLNNRASLGSISLSLHEAGAVMPKSAGLAGAASRSWAGLTGVFYWLIIGAGYLIPIALVGLTIWIILRRRSPRSRRGVQIDHLG